MYESYCQISFVFGVLFCIVSFRRTVRIARGRFRCDACNSVNRTCSATSTLLIIFSFITGLRDSDLEHFVLNSDTKY